MTPAATTEPKREPAPPRYVCCGQCQRPVPRIGRRLQRVNGLRRWVGPCCFRGRS